MASSNIAENITALKQKDRTLQTWSGAGNTLNVTDNHVKTSSQIIFDVRGTQKGFWSIGSIVEPTNTVNGSFVITSTQAETANPTFFYTLI